MEWGTAGPSRVLTLGVTLGRPLFLCGPQRLHGNDEGTGWRAAPPRPSGTHRICRNGVRVQVVALLPSLCPFTPFNGRGIESAGCPEPTTLTPPACLLRTSPAHRPQDGLGFGPSVCPRVFALLNPGCPVSTPWLNSPHRSPPKPNLPQTPPPLPGSLLLSPLQPSRPRFPAGPAVPSRASLFLCVSPEGAPGWVPMKLGNP